MAALVCGAAVSLSDSCKAGAAAVDPVGVEFFEKRVRPILVANCVKCHGPEKQKGELRLDTPSAILKGGELGREIEPGKPDESRLILGVRYTDEDFQMPPDGKLADGAIADLVEWVRIGAPMPKDGAAGDAAMKPGDFLLAERAKHWCYQPVKTYAVPDIAGDAWSRSPIDRFLLERMMQAGLKPARSADARTLLRRVAFDLVGLPPTSEEVEAFVTDGRADVFERVVDRLLASPRYGERWGRHWLDVVRFSETYGHEFDYDLPNAWKYRDYVIRAFNGDVPYDQFVREHIAGDKMGRVDPVDGTRESVIGTAFFWFGDATHSPVDVRQTECDRIDNQIDVMTKAFLAQSVACARCHDHKFDAISTKDYYSLAGFLKSSRYEQAEVEGQEATGGGWRVAGEERQAAASGGVDWAGFHSRLDNASHELVRDVWTSAATKIAGTLMSTTSGSEERTSQRLRGALADAATNTFSHPMFAWRRLARAEAGRFEKAASTLREELLAAKDSAERYRTNCRVLRSTAEGKSWGLDRSILASATAIFSALPERPIAELVPTVLVHSGRWSNRCEGVYRTETFPIDRDYLHYQSCGRGVRVNVVVDGFQLIRDPIYGPLTATFDSPAMAWRTVDLRKWRGHQAYVEFVDHAIPNLTQASASFTPPTEPQETWFAVEEIVLSPDAAPPPDWPSEVNFQVLTRENLFPESLSKLADRYEELAESVAGFWIRGIVQHRGGPGRWTDEIRYLDWLLRAGLLDGRSSKSRKEFEALLAEYRKAESSLRPAPRTPAMCDGTPVDEFVLVRGNPRTPGDLAPRRFLEVIDGPESMETEGSGRARLAERFSDSKNPLAARVMANRIWQHHFGEGIVRSVDDFGKMGSPPTHPELLDWLAGEFVESRFSVKHVHRAMLGSAAYRMLCEASPDAKQKDGRNDLLSHFRTKRLEAEAIRDSLLAVSGRLNTEMGGRGVLPHLTEFSPAIGRPEPSGPRDGAGRRTVYLNVRRNFLSPLLLAFDYPLPQTTIGRRNTSNVPAQALAMLNDPFVLEQAGNWAERLAREGPKDPRERVGWLYLSAFGRPATEKEIEEAVAFVGGGDGGDSKEGWVELCHALMNAKEFIYGE